MSSQLQVSGEAKIRDIQGPVVANSGVITALDGAASQYVRGDGTLADFPTSTGGGSSVSYYLNSSVSQGTIGGVAYRELSKEPIIGAGTDITISANGYVASYITDANDPDVLSVPGGNFNCEFYFSVNNNTGNPTTYAELYKYDGTTFTLLGSSVAVPESLNQGTTIAPYYFAIPVATAALALTDRLAIRIYVNVDGRTVTLHTENSHLCQVVTTFSKGMVSLNNLTDQSQFITTGTSGTNFAIVSSGDTHTFNLPVASATNTGKLSSTDWSTFNAKQPAGNYVTLDTTQTISGLKTFSAASVNIAPTSGDGGILNLKRGAYTGGINDYTSLISQGDNFGIASLTSSSNRSILFDFASITSGILRTYTLPNLSGTLALLEGTQTFSGDKLFNGSVDFNNSVDINSGLFIRNNVIGSTLYTSFTITKASSTQTLSYLFSTGFASNLLFNDAANYSYTFPTASGTIALTSNINYPVTSVFGRTGAVVSSSGDYTTTQVTEGTNLYFTDARARAALSATSPIFYNSTTGVISSQAASATLQGFVTTSSQTIAGVKTFSNGIVMDNGSSGVPLEFKQYASAGYSGTGFTSLFALNNSLCINFGNPSGFIILNTTTLTSNRTFTFQNASGTLALTSDLSAYLPLTGGTLTGALSGTSATFSGLLTINVPTDNTTVGIFHAGGGTANRGLKISTFVSVNDNAGVRLDAQTTAGGATLALATAGVDRLTIASNGAATFSSSVSAAGTMSLDNDGTYGGGYKMLAFTGNANGSHRIFAGTSDDMYFAAATSRGFEFRPNGGTTAAMRITSGGNVGIGTSSPLQESTNRKVLTINGTSQSIVNLGVGGTLAAYWFTTGTSSQLYSVGQLDFNTSNATGFNFNPNGVEAMRITSNGTIGLNGSADVANVNDKFSLGYFNSNYGWLQTWSSTPLYLNKLGNAVYAGSVRLDTLSDERVKDNIQPIENALSKVLSITGKKFHLKDEDESKIRYGFIAQELEGVLDEFVIQTDITFKHKELVVENVKSIENWASSWAALLVEAMKEQQAQIESQDAKIEELKALIIAK